MADLNPFDLLGDDDNDDPSKLIAIHQQKVDPAKKASAPAPAAAKKQPAKLPTKPPPPTQAVREAKTESGRGGGRGGGRGYSCGRGGGGFNREGSNNENFARNREFSGGIAAPEYVEGGRPSERRGGYGGPRAFRGGRQGGFGNGEMPEGDRPRRTFERRSGTGRGSEIKREGAGRGNWGTEADEVTLMTGEVADEGEKNLNVEKPSTEEEAGVDKKENPAAEAADKEPEDKEMTLEEYEKLLEEKRKALQALKTEERKVDTKVFESMQQISKKSSDEIFVKLGSKDKRKESAEKEEKAKKAVSINEFLKPAEGERYYAPGGRGSKFKRKKLSIKSSLAKASKMVRIHVKHGGGSDGDGEFLYDTETSSTIDEIAKDIIEIANLQSKIQCFAVEFESHLSKLQGDPKVMSLVRALSEATSYASKDQVIHNKPLSLYVLRNHTRNIEKEYLVTHSVMGLSSSNLQQFLSDLQILEENTVQLLWAGKELTRGKKLCDFIGRNEKTKIVIRLQSPIPPPASLTGGEKC